MHKYVVTDGEVAYMYSTRHPGYKTSLMKWTDFILDNGYKTMKGAEKLLERMKLEEPHLHQSSWVTLVKDPFLAMDPRIVVDCIKCQIPFFTSLTNNEFTYSGSVEPYKDTRSSHLHLTCPFCKNKETIIFKKRVKGENNG